MPTEPADGERGNEDGGTERCCRSLSLSRSRSRSLSFCSRSCFLLDFELCCGCCLLLEAAEAVSCCVALFPLPSRPRLPFFCCCCCCDWFSRLKDNNEDSKPVDCGCALPVAVVFCSEAALCICANENVCDALPLCVGVVGCAAVAVCVGCCCTARGIAAASAPSEGIDVTAATAANGTTGGKEEPCAGGPNTRDRAAFVAATSAAVTNCNALVTTA